MRILAVADAVSPFIYTQNFPGNLPAFDLVVSAGDMPGYVLEFIASKVSVPVVYVIGNHHNEYLQDSELGTKKLPGGCQNAHGTVLEVAGLLIAGVEGSGRYREGAHQYSERQMSGFVNRMTPRLLYNRLTKGRAADILLTHAAPKGPHEGEDFPHRGIPAFNTFVERWQPRLHIHGHVHLCGANAPREYQTDSGVRVINAFEFTLIEIDLPDQSGTGPGVSNPAVGR